MVLQPRMLSAAPAEVFLHDAVHNGLIAGLEPEGDSQGDLTPVMQHTGIVAELHIVAVDRLPITVFAEQLGGVENLGDKHCPLASGCWREKVQILPNGAAHRAGNADVMLETRQSARY